MGGFNKMKTLNIIETEDNIVIRNAEFELTKMFGQGNEPSAEIFFQMFYGVTESDVRELCTICEKVENEFIENAQGAKIHRQPYYDAVIKRFREYQILKHRINGTIKSTLPDNAGSRK